MPELDVLDVIARKEQDLRARRLAARARADAEIAGARSRAARLQSEREASARAEIETWQQAEFRRVRQRANEQARLASPATPAVVPAGILAAAVDVVVSAVLPRRGAEAAEPPLHSDG